MTWESNGDHFPGSDFSFSGKGSILACMAKYSKARQSMTKYGTVWQSMAKYGKVWHSRHSVRVCEWKLQIQNRRCAIVKANTGHTRISSQRFEMFRIWQEILTWDVVIIPTAIKKVWQNISWKILKSNLRPVQQRLSILSDSRWFLPEDNSDNNKNNNNKISHDHYSLVVSNPSWRHFHKYGALTVGW